MDSAEAQLETFMARYLPGVAGMGRAAIKRMRARLPGCDALVYDNYNALAVGFSPNGKTGAAIVSIALYTRWVSLFFLRGAGLPDTDNLLKGNGSAVRHIVLGSADDLDLPPVRDLIDRALAAAAMPHDPARKGALMIKAISEVQRPRRPAKG
ncbi:DUF1801 domain-containing protein [Novosphingobium sp.]|uniref:DUF1801 domain-containing protein n=1 Tax=Novosphingobium sp. TaxID=1874826 RepID=UPI00286DB6F6|nr:DUF1801 domain-containing protein [Novosphingobium sp.]